MSVTSTRSIAIGFTGDIEYSQSFDAPNSSDGSGQILVQELTTGDNDIVIPDSAVAITIIPPDDSTVVLILKGVSGDTGIGLAPDSPTSIGLDGSGDDFVINAAGAVTVRILFS